MKNIRRLAALLLILALALSCLAGCGKTTVTIDVIHADKTVTKHGVTSRETNLAKILVDHRIVEDNQGDYGLYILVADGETADYTIDGSYWALKKDGEDLMVGASDITVKDGEHYELVYTDTANKITVEVVHKDKTVKTFNLKTMDETLDKVLVNNKIVEDNQGDYGLYILVADGEKADYDVDASYWALQINGTDSMVGASDVKINNGDTYRLVYTIYTF